MTRKDDNKKKVMIIEKGLLHVRKIAAYCCAGTLAWDYYRSLKDSYESSSLSSFAIWTLFIHFIYFQLPFRSRAVAYFHPISFTGSYVVPMSYAYLLVCKPSIEEDHMNQWDLSKNAIWTRSFLIHLAPFLFHTLDINANQTTLINIYKAKSKNTIILWSLIAYGLFGLMYLLVYPSNEEIMGLSISIRDYLWGDKLVSLFASIFAFLILYMMILRKA